jgi:protein-tyrosine phosphatase
VGRLDWDGCANVRDLGGLRTVDGRETAWGAVVRGDTPDNLTPAGWDALMAHGVRTIVDLRNVDERTAMPARPDGIETVHVPLDGVEDTEFWSEWGTGPQFGTPLYYRPHLERFPERNARAIAAVAQAEPGGVLIHCVGGKDRAGQIAMLLIRSPPAASPASSWATRPSAAPAARRWRRGSRSSRCWGSAIRRPGSAGGRRPPRPRA